MQHICLKLLGEIWDLNFVSMDPAFKLYMQLQNFDLFG